MHRQNKLFEGCLIQKTEFGEPPLCIKAVRSESAGLTQRLDSNQQVALRTHQTSAQTNSQTNKDRVIGVELANKDQANATFALKNGGRRGGGVGLGQQGLDHAWEDELGQLHDQSREARSI